MTRTLVFTAVSDLSIATDGVVEVVSGVVAAVGTSLEGVIFTEISQASAARINTERNN